MSYLNLFIESEEEIDRSTKERNSKSERGEEGEREGEEESEREREREREKDRQRQREDNGKPFNLTEKVTFGHVGNKRFRN